MYYFQLHLLYLLDNLHMAYQGLQKILEANNTDFRGPHLLCESHPLVINGD